MGPRETQLPLRGLSAQTQHGNDDTLTSEYRDPPVHFILTITYTYLHREPDRR